VSDPDGVVVVSDGRNTKAITGPTEVTVSRTVPPMRIAGPESDFFEALEKLS
jgi:NAD+ kinase